MLKCQIISSRDWHRELEGAWQELTDAAPAATPFQTWEWQSAWWRFYRGSKRPYIMAAYEGKDLVGLYPLAAHQFPWRSLVAVGHGKSDYLPPLVREGYADEVGHLFGAAIREDKGIDYVNLAMIPEGNALLEGARESDVRSLYPCPILDLNPRYDEYLKSLTYTLRTTVQRFQAQKDTEGGSRIRTASGPEAIDGLRRLFDLHSMRWSQRGSPGGFAFSRLRTMFEYWATLAAPRGWVKVDLLEVEGRTVGAMLVSHVGRSCFFHNIGFDPAVASISPGSLLIGDAIREATEAGLAHFDFMLGDEPYKARWKPQRKVVVSEWKAVQPGFRSSMAVGWYDRALPWGVRARRRVKALMMKRGGESHGSG